MENQTLRVAICAALLTFLLTAVTLADQPLSGRLELVPNRTLPGVPVFFVINVTNPNPTAKPFYPYTTLAATDAHGAVFTARWGQREDGAQLTTPRTGQGATTTLIPAGATVTYSFQTGRHKKVFAVP